MTCELDSGPCNATLCDLCMTYVTYLITGVFSEKIELTTTVTSMHFPLTFTEILLRLQSFC